MVKEKEGIKTRLQEFEVRQIADVYAGAKGYNLSEYQAPEIVNSKIGEWHLFYDQVYPPRNEIMPDKHFSIYIDDNTGEVLRLMPGL